MTKQSRKLMMGAVTGAAVLATGQANAFQFSAGDVTGYLDTTLKFGALIRAEERMADARGHSRGNMNTDEGDLANFTLTGTVDFGLSYGDYGAFIRATASYDPVYDDLDENELPDATSPFGPQGCQPPLAFATGCTAIDGMPEEAKDRAATDARFLDSYVYGNWILGDHYLSARVGSQVINWGESVFTGNGLNVVNPVDLAKLRVPGAELKEGLVPVNSVWFSATLTDNLSLEAYYKIEWEQFQLDPVGTYFSTSNAVGDGAKYFATIPNQALQANAYPDEDEYGLSFRYIVEDWDSAELGFYAIRYNSAAPAFNLTIDPATGGPGSYNLIYAEAIDLYGMTLSTVLFEHSVSIEYSYRKDLPVATALNQVSLADGTVIAPNSRRVPVGQLLINDVYAYGPNNPIGADQFSTVIEIGYVRNFDFDPVFKDTSLISGSTLSDLRTSRSAWGGRARITADYNNAIGNWTLKPLVDLAMGVNGVAANGSFKKDVKNTTFSLEGVLLSKYSLQAVYSRSFGGGRNNSSIDRDYIGFNGKVSF